MKESQILCVAFLYINMLHFLEQRVKMQFPSWSIDVVAGSGGPVCRSQLALDPCLIYDTFRQTKEWRQAAEPA